MQYKSAEESDAADRVQYDGTYATIVFASHGETEQAAPAYEDYAGSTRGGVMCDEDGLTTGVGQPDERLSFVDRG